MLLAARGVLGGKLYYLDPATLGGSAQRSNALRFVIFHADEGFLRADNIAQDFCTLDDLVCALAHQDVIGGDIGLAFGAINNQCFNMCARLDGQLDRAGKTRAAHTGDPGVSDQVDQRQFVHGLVVRPAAACNPFILAVRRQHDARCEVSGGVCDLAILYGADGA